MQINSKGFSENSWETLGFSRTILIGNLARSREYRQYRKQKQRQQKGDEKRTRYEVTKIAPSPFSQEGYPFWGRGTGDGEWGLRREGRGESNLICLSPGESHPFKLDKLTTSHPFSPILYHHLLTHPGSTSFFAKFLVYVTVGWKFDRTDQTALSFKIACEI